jgi:hypothetical protein
MSKILITNGDHPWPVAAQTESLQNSSRIAMHAFHCVFALPVVKQLISAWVASGSQAAADVENVELDAFKSCVELFSEVSEGESEKSASASTCPSARAALARTLSPSRCAASTQARASFDNVNESIAARSVTAPHKLATAQDAGSLTDFDESLIAAIRSDASRAVACRVFSVSVSCF